jgi:hypothetical protein
MCTMHGGSSLALLQAGPAGLDGADANDLTDGQVRDEVAALLVAVNQLTAVLSIRVGVFDARDLGTGAGFRTTRSWLVAFGRGEVSAEHLAKVYGSSGTTRTRPLRRPNDIHLSATGSAQPPTVDD